MSDETQAKQPTTDEDRYNQQRAMTPEELAQAYDLEMTTKSQAAQHCGCSSDEICQFHREQWTLALQRFEDRQHETIRMLRELELRKSAQPQNRTQ
jgi:hypothetical protein